jgi:hypothetical protein
VLDLAQDRPSPEELAPGNCLDGRVRRSRLVQDAPFGYVHPPLYRGRMPSRDAATVYAGTEMDARASQRASVDWRPRVHCG